MNIKNITADDLRRMEDKEGLILQGCGGDPKEWVDGINQMLTEEGILLEGTEFTEVSVFEHDGLACILYPFEDVKIAMGKLAVWRLQTHETFGGTWLSDYVPNRLGGFRKESVEKPDCALNGENGNIFNLAGLAAGTLREHGMKEQAEEMKERVCSSHSYEEALCIIGEYVNITSRDGQELVYSVLSVVVGGGIVLLLYRHVGLTVSTYIAIPVVAPIAMTGFYSYHGMTFVEMMKLKLHFAFANRALTYVSTEGEQAVQKLRQEETQGQQKKKNKAVSRKGMGKTETDREGFDKDGFDKARKKMFRMLTAMVLFFVLFVALAVWYKYR